MVGWLGGWRVGGGKLGHGQTALSKPGRHRLSMASLFCSTVAWGAFERRIKINLFYALGEKKIKKHVYNTLSKALDNYF